MNRLDHMLRGDRLQTRLLSLLHYRIWLIDHCHITQTQQILLLAALVGIIGGLSTVLLRTAMNGLHILLTGRSGGLVESFAAMAPYRRLLIPAAGGAVAGAIIHFGSRLGRSARTTDYMEAVALGRGSLSLRSTLVKVTSATFSVASGASIGREGPLVQLSALLASLLGRFRKWSAPRRHVLVACGAAAGVAAAYNAPIAGALFVSEIMLQSIAMETLGPLVVSSVLATQVMRWFRGSEPLYSIPDFHLASGWELALYAVLGVLCGLLAPLFLRLLGASESVFGTVRVPAYIRMALGGLVVGAIAMYYPQVCGNGYSVIVSILNVHWMWQSLVVVLALKILATCATFGSGAVGGVLTPTLFVGAGLGYLFGVAGATFAPDWTGTPGAYALAGMGMFIAAATRAPLTAILMVFEMTLDSNVIIPLMLGCVTAYYTANAIDSRSLYSHALARKSVDIQPLDFAAMPVSELMRTEAITVRTDSPFSAVVRAFIANNIKYLYVLDAKGAFRGVISLQDTKPFLNNPQLADVVIAIDIMRDSFPMLYPDSTITETIEAFGHHDGERLPVVTRGEHVLVGRVAKADVMIAFAHRAAPSPAAV
jgi:CIC family chloride channel protein